MSELQVRKNKDYGITWCGPAALTALLNCSYEEAENFLGARHKSVEGVYDHQMKQVLEEQGKLFRNIYRKEFVREPNSLKEVHQRMTDYKVLDTPKLVSVTTDQPHVRHYVIMLGAKCYDNKTVNGIDTGDHPCNSDEVRGLWNIIDRKKHEEWVASL